MNKFTERKISQQSSDRPKTATNNYNELTYRGCKYLYSKDSCQFPSDARLWLSKSQQSFNYNKLTLLIYRGIAYTKYRT